MRSLTEKSRKKLDMTMLYEFILLVAVIVIVSLLVFQVNEDAREDMEGVGTWINCGTNSSGGSTGTISYTNCSTAYNSTISADEAVAKIPSSLKLLGTAVVFGAVLWVILRVIPMGQGSAGFQ